MNPLETWIVVAWIASAVVAVVSLVILGRTDKYMDRTMARHLWAVLVFYGLEPIALLFVGVSLWPVAVITTAGVAIGIWRIALQFQSRRVHDRDPER